MGGVPPIFQAYVWGGNVLMHPESKIFPAQKPIISQGPWGGLSMLDRSNIHFKTRESQWKGPQGPGTLIYMSYWGIKYFRSQQTHKTGPQGTPWAYTYAKYRTRHTESNGDDPEARGPLFISVMPPRNFRKIQKFPDFRGACPPPL